MNTSIELQKAVESYSNGNKESFNQIYEFSYKYLHTCVIHVVKDEDITMDMLQETYLEVSKSISQLKNKEGFLNWAATIANRKCYAYLKKQKDIVLYANDSDDETDDFFENIADNEEFIPETVLQDREKQRLIKEIIDDLTEIQRLCVIGFYYNEQKQEEIAEELGIPVNTVKSHLNRAKVKIKEAVVELDEKKGTRLYSMAPFMLLFFGMEAEACEYTPMNFSAETAGNGDVLAGESGRGVASTGQLKATGMALKTKVIIGAIVGGLAVAGTAIILMLSNKNVAEDNLEQTSGQATEVVSEVVESEVVEEIVEINDTLTDFNPLAISGLYDSYGYGHDGLIVVVKDNLYGLVTYDNEVVVPIQYTYGCIEVNEEGQSFFGDGSQYYVFDQNGVEIFRTTRQIRSVNEGVVCAVDGSDFDAKIAYYRLSDGTEIYVNDNLDYNDAGAVGFNEGYGFYALDDPTRIDIDGNTVSFTEVIQSRETESAQSNGNIIVDSAGSSFVLAIPIGSMKEGYFVTRSILASEDGYGIYTVWNKDVTESHKIDLGSIYDLRGENIWSSSEAFTLNYYFDGGVAFYNYGTIMCATVGDADYLVDVAKVEDQEYVSVKEEITGGALLATAERIIMSGENYWLTKQDGKWGYIDHAGKVMAMYDDAAAFGNGKALIIENGIVYVIDENFTKIKELGQAESVTNYGEIFRVTTTTEEFMILPEQY